VPRTLDYSATWRETLDSFRAHKDGVIAFAGLALFIPSWIYEMVIRQLDLESVKPGPAFWALIGEHFSSFWYAYLPIMIVSVVGTASIYALLTRKELPRIGDAMMAGLAVAPMYFVAQLLCGMATGVALLALIIPGFYVSARLSACAPAIVAQPGLGVTRSISHSWELTRDNGWAIFVLLFIVALVAGISMLVVQLISNLIITMAAGPEGIPLLQTGITAITQTALNVLMMLLGTAIYHQLSAQDT
jgi:uncharacterized membrane protein